MELPNYLIVRANAHHAVVHDDEKYVLLRYTTDQLFFVDDPLSIVQDGVWQTAAGMRSPQRIKVERHSSRHGMVEYECTITRQREFIRIPRMEDIYVYTITGAYKVLSSKFYKVGAGSDREKRFHFEKRDVAFPAIPVVSAEGGGNERLPVGQAVAPPASAPPPVAANIPQHIFRCFVDSAIEKKEECPITMEPLIREKVAGTSCGHLFDREAITRVLRDSGRCPTCRCETQVENLQTY